MVQQGARRPARGFLSVRRPRRRLRLSRHEKEAKEVEHRKPSPASRADRCAHEHHAAVAEADMRGLHNRRHAVQHDDLMAPIETGRLRPARTSVRRRRSPSHCRCLDPSARVAADGVIARRSSKIRIRAVARAPALRCSSLTADQAPLSIFQASGAAPGARTKTTSPPTARPCEPYSVDSLRSRAISLIVLP
jgi:hypothetical protein